MTKLLEQAIEEAKKLPESEQDSIAAIILEELEGEKLWDEKFAASHDVLRKMAAEALKEYRSGKTQLLDPDKL